MFVKVVLAVFIGSEIHWLIIKNILTVLRFHFFLSYSECVFLAYCVGDFFEMSFFYWGCACVCVCTFMLHLWASEDNFGCWPHLRPCLRQAFLCSLLCSPDNLHRNFWGFYGLFLHPPPSLPFNTDYRCKLGTWLFMGSMKSCSCDCAAGVFNLPTIQCL